MDYKYVELLKLSYERLKNVDVIYSQSSDDSAENKQNDEDKVKLISKTNKGNKKIKSTAQRRSLYANHKPFLENEDKIILDAMKASNEKKEKINLSDLSKVLKRNYSAIQQRIFKLERTGVSEIKNVRFSIEEDMIIIDDVLDKLIQSDKGLKDIYAYPSEIVLLGKVLKRYHFSVYEHWQIKILPTILGHYHKCLNLNIREMLANFLADNFDCSSDIDWKFVLEQPEFLGHTLPSLKKISSKLLYGASKTLSIDKQFISLKQVAACVKTKRRFNEKVLVRQMKTIEYFEKACIVRGLNKERLKL